MEKQRERHGWLTANGTELIISKTNKLRKEDAYGAEHNENSLSFAASAAPPIR